MSDRDSSARGPAPEFSSEQEPIETYEVQRDSKTLAASAGRQLAAAAAGVGVLAVAAYVTALVVGRFGEPGLLLIWGSGVLSGVAAKNVLGQSTSRAVGVLLIVGCLLATTYVEVHYIRFHMKQGEDGWLASLKLLPTFLQQFQMSAIVAAVATVLGGMSGYRQVANRWRYIRVAA